MSQNKRGLSFFMVLAFAVVAGMIFLSFATARRRAEPISLDADFSAGFTGDPRSRLEREIQSTRKKIDDRVALITRRAKQAGNRAQGFGESISESIQWLNQSIESLTENLEKISERLESTEDDALIEAEVKRAFRDAFLKDSHPGSDPVEEAEVTTESQGFEKLADASDLPILGEDVPDWVRQRVIEEDRILVPIESSMHGTLEECRSELASRLPEEVKKVIDQYVLRQVSADSLDGLTSEYIRDNLVDHSTEFDNYQERPSGNFHQLWVKLDIDKKAMEQMREWERESTTVVRVWMLSGFSLAFLGSFAGLSEVFKFLSTRERNRRRGRQTA